MKSSVLATRMCGFSVASLLREAYPEDGAKRAARAADVSPRTAEAWMTGRREPAASVLLRMAARCDRMADRLQGILDARTAAAPADRPASGGGGAAAPRGGQVTP